MLMNLLGQPCAAFSRVFPFAVARTARDGFTLIELMIAISIIVVLSALAIPNYKAYRKSSLGARCSANLKGVAGAVTLYRANNPQGVKPEMNALTTYFQNRTGGLKCPLDGDTYTLKGERWKPVCPNGRQDYATGVEEGHYIPGEVN